MSMKGLTTAIRTLTAIPIPGSESRELSSALPWFPVVGLLLGGVLLLSGLVWSTLPFPQWPAGCAMLLLILDVLLTRGLHMDGLADWADSIGGFGREKRLAIMKDVSVGAFGTLALILAMMTKWIVFYRLASSNTLIWIILVMIISRSMIVELVTTMPYARSEDGMARPFIEKATGNQRSLSFMITLALCLLFGPVGAVLLVMAWVVTLIFKAYCRKEFGGVTGDLLGAANEFIEVILLTACALPGQYISDCSGWGWIF
jgi:adenosylcobinamide-GDP ribazoletransferase